MMKLTIFCSLLYTVEGYRMMGNLREKRNSTAKKKKEGKEGSEKML